MYCTVGTVYTLSTARKVDILANKTKTPNGTEVRNCVQDRLFPTEKKSISSELIHIALMLQPRVGTGCTRGLLRRESTCPGLNTTDEKYRERATERECSTGPFLRTPSTKSEIGVLSSARGSNDIFTSMRRGAFFFSTLLSVRSQGRGGTVLLHLYLYQHLEQGRAQPRPGQAADLCMTNPSPPGFPRCALQPHVLISKHRMR